MIRKTKSVFIWSICIALIFIGVGIAGTAAQTPEPTAGCEDVPAYFEAARALVPNEISDYLDELRDSDSLAIRSQAEFRDLVPLFDPLVVDLREMESSVPPVATSYHELEIQAFILLQRFTQIMADGGDYFSLMLLNEEGEEMAENREEAEEHGRDICGDLWPADSDEEEDRATPSP